MCKRCYEKQPERPLMYAARLEQRLFEVPDWFGAFVEYVTLRLSPSRARDVLREFGRHVNTLGSASPPRLAKAPPPRLGRLLVPFLTGRGLVLAGENPVTVRYRERRQRRVEEVPGSFRAAAAAFAATLERRQQRAIRLGSRAHNDETLEDSLRTLRNFAKFCAARGVVGWETVAVVDVEAFLARNAPPRKSELADLRSFFRWARRQRVVLTSPVEGLRIAQPKSFHGEVLDHTTQRALFQRWTSATAAPYEALFGLAALIHGATTAEIRNLKLNDIDRTAHTLRLGRRRDPLPLDPATWDALQRAVEHRATQRGANPHLIVTRFSASGDGPAGDSYFATLLTPAGVTPQALRTTRMSALANRADPVVIAAVCGVTFKAAAYYRNDQIDAGYHDHLVKLTATR